jgi:hypothetical protein
MTTILKNRLITTDVSNPSTTAVRSIAPSTVGIQNNARHIPREQRAAKSTTEKGERFTGKQLKAAARDCANSILAATDALNVATNGMNVAKAAGNDSDAELYEEMGRVIMGRLVELAEIGLELQEQVNAEKEATPQAEATTDETGLSEFHGKAAGAPEDDCPANQANRTGMDAAAMDAGRAGVLDHLAAVGEPGTPTNPYVMDGLKLERARDRAIELACATNPARVLAGLDDEVLTDYSQLNFERDNK